MPSANNEDRQHDEDVLYNRTPWTGVSCTSFFWPYTQRIELSETRRAVANLTHGLQYALATPVLAGKDEASVADVLSFVKAADDVHKASEQVLREVVAEARSRGATWEQIGKALNVPVIRQAAHNRFSDGIPDRRKSELKHEATACVILDTYWSGGLSAKELGEDSPDEEGVTIETFVDYAVRSAVKAADLYDAYINESRGATGDLDELLRVYKLVRTSAHMFMFPEVLEAVSNYSDTGGSWVNTNASIYFVQTACHLMFAFQHFNKLWPELNSGDGQAVKQRLAYIYRNLLDVTENLSRPECVGVVANIDEWIANSGNFVYMAKRKEEGIDYNSTEILEAIWRKDKVKMAQMLNTDEFPVNPSLDDLLDR